MRSFYILNERASVPSTPASRGAVSRRSGWRARLRFRDIIWAFHSETQGLLLSASLAACLGKMTMSDARALGVFLWLNSVESMVRKVSVLMHEPYSLLYRCRDLTWSSSLGLSIWPEMLAIQSPAHCFTLRSENISLCMDSGGRLRGIRSKRS
jgi:hypothetical protein